MRSQADQKWLKFPTVSSNKQVLAEWVAQKNWDRGPRKAHFRCQCRFHTGIALEFSGFTWEKRNSGSRDASVYDRFTPLDSRSVLTGARIQSEHVNIGGSDGLGMRRAMTEPRDWKVAPFARVGTQEPFVREMLEVLELLKGTMVVNQQREQANDAIATILTDGLIPAFLELRTIRSPETNNLPLAEKFQPYEDFARKLWKAYKDLTQRAAESMGFDVGFLYQKDTKFEEGMKKFRADWPSLQGGFEDFMRQTRTEWQNEFSKFRNGFVEHQEGKRTEFRKFYDNAFVEQLFELVWGTVVDLLVLLFNLKLRPGTHIVVNDPDVHGPWPNRFRWVIDGLGPTRGCITVG